MRKYTLVEWMKVRNCTIPYAKVILAIVNSAEYIRMFSFPNYIFVNSKAKTTD